jgi:hypothetical protein
MTLQELKTLIADDPTATAFLAAKNYAACANRCIVLAPKIHVPTVLTQRGLYEKLGAVVGETILQKLENYASAAQTLSPVVARILPWLEPANEGLDFGDVKSLEILAALSAAEVFTSAEHTALVGMSLVHQTITPSHVELAGLL